jgi:glycosyltransferase involved in cell wall biosynthesis
MGQHSRADDIIPGVMAAQKPSIAILHYTAPPIVGGVESIISEHARLLNEAGYPTCLVVGRGGDGLPPGQAIRLIPAIDTGSHVRPDLAEALNRGEVPAGFDAARDQIAAALVTALSDIDVLIVHNVMTMHFNLPLTAALHKLLNERRLPRCVAWNHDASWDDPEQRPFVHPGYPWELLKTLRRDVTYVVITRARQEQLARMFNCPPGRLRVIPNGVSLRFWWNLSAEGDALITDLGLLDGDIFVLQPVRITQLKNIAYSLRVVAALKATGLRPRFLVSGPPDPHDPAGRQLLADLRLLRRELGLEAEAYFAAEHGPDPDVPRVLSFDVVRDLYEACDLILLPSMSEGFGIPVIEAGVLGRPVFCADIPPFREIGSRLVHRFKLTDAPESVAGRIAAWARRDRTFQLRRRVGQFYTWRAVRQQYMEPLVNRLARRPRAARKQR